MAKITDVSAGNNAAETPSTTIDNSTVSGINAQVNAGTTNATSAATSPTNANATATPTTKITVPESYSNNDYATMLNDMYDMQYQQGVQELENAYNESVIEYNRTAEKIPETYNTQRNTLSANYEKHKRNFNLMAAASGINTGTASQESLARLNAYQNNLTIIATAQADAQTEIDFQLASLKRQKQQQVASLLTNNQIAKAQAAITAWQDGREQEQARANVLAQYGDFSTFLNLGYTPEQVSALETAWAYNNPNLAKLLNPEAYARAYGTTTTSNIVYDSYYWGFGSNSTDNGGNSDNGDGGNGGSGNSDNAGINIAGIGYQLGQSGYSQEQIVNAALANGYSQAQADLMANGASAAAHGGYIR